MKRISLISIITGLVITMSLPTIKAQLFEKLELYPNVVSIKGKYNNGSGGNGYWSLEKVDSVGRIIEKKRYRKNKLMSTNEIQYDIHNNKTFDIQTYDSNKPGRIDTFRYEYIYSGNQIVQQYQKLSKNDSTVTKLINNVGDSILSYLSNSYYYRPKTKKNDVYKVKYTLTYQGALLVKIKSKKIDYSDNSEEITNLKYNIDGRLKRRIIKKEPNVLYESVYVGGPGSDDMSFDYKLDKSGRILKHYSIINGKKYKIATYEYE